MRPALRLAQGALARGVSKLQTQTGPRHFLSISDLNADELTTLVKNAGKHKQTIKALGLGQVSPALGDRLKGRTIAMMFNKRSTRTRVSTEAAVAAMGGHSMFLGKDDIQLGVNESLYDTSKVISSMTSCMVARVGAHADIVQLAENSAVPVINALSDRWHPLQTIADILTVHEAFPGEQANHLLRPNLKFAWVGDANNVLYDLAAGCLQLGVHIAVASPPGYAMPADMVNLIEKAAHGSAAPGKLTLHAQPEEAVEDADILVTDTWVSMGQEAETAKRLRAFKGFQITESLASRGGAKRDWKFMHCLPRHPEEVDDEVFYGPRSLVFPEAENRLWAAIAALEAFVVNKGNIV